MKTTLMALMMMTYVSCLCADDTKTALPDKDAMHKLITEYHKTPFADRGKFVAEPEVFGKLQEAYYNGKSLNLDFKSTITSIKQGAKTNQFTVVAQHTIKEGNASVNENNVYNMITTKEGIKIDWCANTGYNEVGLKAWAAGDDKQITLRVEAKLDDFYNYQYKNSKATHYSIGVVERYQDRSPLFWGYVLKDSPTGKRIYEILKDGDSHEMTIMFERTGEKTIILGISKLVSESWAK